MAFLTLITRNLLRQRVRSLLTTIGIGIGIATLVALGVLVASTNSATEGIIHVGGADLMVAQNGAADLSFSTLTADDASALQDDPDVERTAGVLLLIAKVEELPFFLVYGESLDDLERDDPRITDGRMPTRRDERWLLLGERVAGELDADVGDTVDVSGRDLEVVGIYTDSNAQLNGGSFADIDDVQDLARRPDSYSVAYVHLRRGVDAARFARHVENRYPNLAAVRTLDDYGKVDQGTEIIDGLNFAISLLAVLIGAIGVMNTMVMSVFERTREIGILQAIGWSRLRIIRMIVGEAVGLCLAGAVFGCALGTSISLSLRLSATFRTLLVLEFPPEVFARAVAVAFSVALLGASYPAWRATRMTPMEALRHE